MRFSLVLLAVAYSVQAAAAPRDDVTRIPQRPSAPPSLGQRLQTTPFSCERTYVQKGKALPCDSNVQRDGEGLRPILQDVPAAVSELNLYQRNRRTLRNTAYLVTLGLALTIVGSFVSRPPLIESGSVKPGGYLVFGGLGVGVGSLAYGLSLSKANEGHIQNAAQEYNKVHPNTPIQLQFTTGISF